MPTLFVLNVDEFHPLIERAREQVGVSVQPGPRGYTRISAEGELRFNRKALGFKPAVWYGALTGGLVGRIAEFSRDELHIVGEAS
ncbi:hypothetical protein [Hydrogenophaga sp. ZJX-1]|uniref:hypothetical protein n=1 Tax=Hydrogenophaga sp. ZJX-1 TaxID=3404778 RepID=UPI003B27B805